MRAIVAVLLLACLAAVAWFVFDDIQPAPIAPAAAPASAMTPIPAAAVTQTAPVPAEKEPRTDPAVEAGVNQREAVAPQFAGPVGEVQVVRFDTKAPVAGATVYCWPPDFDLQKLSPELMDLQRRDNDEFLKKIGLSLTTDTEGRCRVPLSRFGAQVIAVKDELWGQRHLPKDATEPVVIRLRVDQTLHVLVVDAGGKPARGSNVMARRKGGDRPTDLLLGVTDAAGRIVHRHSQASAVDPATHQLDLVALFPGGESAPARVDVTAPPPDVLLQLPPGGTVTVHVRDAEDKPIDPAFLGEPSANIATFVEKPSNERAALEGRGRAQAPPRSTKAAMQCSALWRTVGS